MELPTADQEAEPTETPKRRGKARSIEELGPRYKWIALSNTTLGMLMATINSSIVLIALPDIFRGIAINPLSPSNTSYLLWMIMGFLVVTAVLVVGLGRLGDMYGRVRMYNLGFAIFAVASVLLAVTWNTGGAAAMWLIFWRVIQGVGGAFLMANSSALLTDAFPVHQRGLALGINSVAAIAGSFFGLVIGGLLGPLNWHLVFLVSVPFGVFGTIWAYLMLHDTSERHRAKMDWWGNITFAVGLIAILVGITYGIQPYGGQVMGWTSPMVLGCIIGGVVVLVLFGIIETQVANPLFNLSLFKLRSFSFGNIANLLASLGRGGLQFVLIIWLQGIWLPQHGYSFEETPLWAGIYMLPLTIGFLVSAPISGALSDRIGARWFTTGGMVVAAISFLLLGMLPVNFNYWTFAVLLLLNGLGMGLFASPNRADVMNSLPSGARGAGAGMTATFQNAAMVLSIGFFFSLMIAGLSNSLPTTMEHGLIAHGVPAASAHQVAMLPPVAVLFAALLGYNPIQQLLGPILNTLPANQASYLTGRSFFPNLISHPFSAGLDAAFWFAVIACFVAAIASFLCGPKKRITPAVESSSESVREEVGSELAAVAAASGTFPTELVDMGASPQEREITGRVTTLNGRDITGCVVTVTSSQGKQVARTTTDDYGHYVINGLEPGAYTLITTATGFHPEATTLTLNGRGQAHDFRLRGTGLVFGAVRTSRGGPGVPSTTVLAVDSLGRVIDQRTTAEDGTFELTGLAAGEYTIVASGGAEPVALRVELDEGDSANIELVLGSDHSAQPWQSSRS
jgi:MFS family permease